MWVNFALLGGGAGLGFLGLIALVVFLFLVAAGKVRMRLRCGVPYGGVYAETFAVWMALFAGLGLAARWLLQYVSLPFLLAEGGVTLLSLVALGWPVLRGIPWPQVRQDIGWTLGRRPLLEPLLGVGCYLMSLPLLVVGVFLFLVLVLLQQALAGDQGGALEGVTRSAHPIVGYVVHSDWWQKVQILVLAAVVAPIAEETMFRGVLYRHLREASCRLRTWVSFLVSATVVSFLFAAIHPQGLLTVPVLMSLAYGFALAREWRGTVIPCMVGHALNNALAMLLSMLVLGQ
jgi:membrane protease YdiL (CAAX protease family)